MTNTFTKFPSINNFHNVYHDVLHYAASSDSPPPDILYRPKIKLHGTNAAVRITSDGKVTAQKRSSDVFPDRDNCGFAAWVKENEESFKAYAKHIQTHEEPLVIHGEWAGPGVQKGVAVSNIREKNFFVFALQQGDRVQVCPETIVDKIIHLPYVSNMVVLPWAGESLIVAFNQRDQVMWQLDYINKHVAEVEACDPYIQRTFAVEGVGEGLVYVPSASISQSPSQMSRDFYSRYMFKAKGEKHQTTNAKKPAQIDPEKVKSLHVFADLVLTDVRMEQGLVEAYDGEERTMRNLPLFLKWIDDDINKECQAELDSSGLTWNEASKVINKRAVAFYKSKLMDI